MTKIKWYYPILPCIIGWLLWIWYIFYSLESSTGISALFFLLWWKIENLQLQIKEFDEK